MSTIDVANITDGTDTVATSYVVNGSAKAWVASWMALYITVVLNVSVYYCYWVYSITFNICLQHILISVQRNNLVTCIV